MSNNFTNKFEKLNFPNIGLIRFPVFTIDEEDRTKLNISPTTSNKDFLKKACWAGYKERRDAGQFKDIDEKTVIDRFKLEFDVFEKTGIFDYILFIYDVSKFCIRSKINLGKARGSSASSLSLYCLRVTDINPLHYGLIFSRFVSEARLKPVYKEGILYLDGKAAPDVDTDVEYLRRPEVLQYIETKYKGQVAKICTRLALTGKTALKDTLKVYLDYDDSSAMRITSNIEAHFGKMESLETAEKKKEIKDWLEESTDNQDAMKIAKSICDLTIAKGQHPSGIMIHHELIDGNVPTERTKTGDFACSYEMEVASGISIKGDYLGLRSIDVVSQVSKLVGEDFSNIDLDDKSIYEYLSSSDMYEGLFQIEEGITKDAVRKIKPRNIFHIAAAISISRPGALAFIPDYAKYVNTGEFTKIHPAFDKIMEETGGVLIYQETITKICEEIYGLSAVDADGVRYIVGKKKKDEMKKWEPILYAKGEERGIPKSATEYFWKVCNNSADYLFCRAHAFAYASLTATMTYVKAKYPKEFYLALLRLSNEEPDPISYMNKIFSEMGKRGIKIYPPSIIKSGKDFSIESDGLRFGLGAIKGVSEVTMAKLVSFRREFDNKFSIFDNAKESKLSIAVVAGLISCGCIESGNITRAKLNLEAQTYNILTPKEKRLIQSMVKEHGDDLLNLLLLLTQKTDEKGKPYIKASRFETIKRDYSPFKSLYLTNSKLEELTNYIMEKTYLGFSYSGSLYNIFNKKVEGLMPLDKASTEPKDIHIKFVGFIDEIKSHVSREKKTPYLKMEISSDEGKIKAMLFGDERIEQLKQFHSRLPEEGDIVIIHGKKADGDAVFVDKLFIQTNPVKIKKSELNKGDNL